MSVLDELRAIAQDSEQLDEGCRYATDPEYGTPVPCCIVGHWLYNRGVSVEELVGLDALEENRIETFVRDAQGGTPFGSALLTEILSGLSPADELALCVAQAVQDGRMSHTYDTSWTSAVNVAEREIRDSLL